MARGTYPDAVPARFRIDTGIRYRVRTSAGFAMWRRRVASACFAAAGGVIVDDFTGTRLDVVTSNFCCCA